MLKYLLLASSLVFSTAATAQEIVLRPGESAEVGPVYWIANCKSMLKGFAGVDLITGPPEVKAFVREEPVNARRQGCTEKVPGGTLMLSAGGSVANFEGPVRIRVRYSTDDGEKYSNHSVKLMVVAPQK